jgi:hypothetical protein
VIAVPYVPEKLHFETAAWAANHGAHMRDVSGDDTAYHAALCDWWAEPGDLLLVEHDMLPAGGVVEEMLNCPEAWCSSPYLLSQFKPENMHYSHRYLLFGLYHWVADGVTVEPYSVYLTLDGVVSEPYSLELFDRAKAAGVGPNLTDGLGCTKFSAALKSQLPSLMVDSVSVQGCWPSVWWHADVRITRLLREQHGQTPHLHAPSSHRSVT